jgi:hypothetical protein
MVCVNIYVYLSTYKAARYRYDLSDFGEAMKHTNAGTASGIYIYIYLAT